MRLHHFIYLAVAIGLSLPTHPCSARERGKVTLRFLSIPRVDNPEPVRLQVGKDKTIVVEIPTNEFSPRYEVEAMADWMVVGAVEGGGKGARSEELGTAPALDSPEQLILLVRKGPANSDGFRVIPIDTRAEGFGGGMFLFVNATEFEFGGEVGGHSFGIEPGQYSIAEPEPEEEGSNLCHGALYYTKDGIEKPFYSSKWPISDQARGLFFLYQDLKTSRLRLHSLREFM